MKLLSAMLAGLASFTVSANMTIMSGHMDQVETVVSGQRVEIQQAPLFRQRGFGEASYVKGHADSLPLSFVMQQILPVGWTAYIDPGFAGLLQSWKGEGKWPDILQSITHAKGADTLIDWTQKVVYIGPEARNAYEVVRGTVQKNLQLWAQQAGWSLVYLPVNQYWVEYGSVLEVGTEFEDAVIQLIGSYRNNNHRKRVKLHAEFNHSNRVLVIGHRKSEIKQYMERL